MPSRIPSQLRRLVYQAHLWVAVVLFLALVPLGFSGTILAWPEVVNRPYAASPAVAAAAAPALSPSAYLDAARAALPGAKLQTLKMPASPGEAVSVSASNGRPGPGGGRTIWLDPQDGAVLKVAPSVSPLFAWSHDFHGAFTIRGVGRQLVGWAGVAMLLLSVTGIWLWWPRGAFGKAFRWRRTPSTLLNLHHLVGFWISIPLAVVSLTGIFICFQPLASAVFGPAPPRQQQEGGPAPTPAAPGRRGGDRGDPTLLTAEAAVAAARATHPEASRLIAVTLPGAGRGPAASRNAWRIDLAGSSGAPVSVLVDRSSGTVTDAPAPRRQDNARTMNRQIHEGGGSLVWKWIVTLTGIAPTLLAITGVVAWARTEMRKRRLRTGTT